MHYITQYIKECQIKYPRTNNNSCDVLSHLFFVNGNGISFKNGNPVINVEFDRNIEFKDYYKECKEFGQLPSAEAIGLASI